MGRSACPAVLLQPCEGAGRWSWVLELMKYLISSFPLRAHGLGLLELVCSRTCMADSSKMFRAFLHVSDTCSHVCQNPGTTRDVEAAVQSIVGEVR